MKLKKFRNPRLIGGILIGVVLGAFETFFVVYTFIAFKKQNFQLSEDFLSTFGLLWLILIVIGAGMYIPINRETFSHLIIDGDIVIWRCPFIKTVRLNAKECFYVNLADDLNNAYNKMPIVRGDERTYICLSVTPFDEKFKHKVVKIKSRKGIIKYAYSDQLCQALIEILPEDKTVQLRNFYNRMQVQDLILKQNKERKKSQKK